MMVTLSAHAEIVLAVVLLGIGVYFCLATRRVIPALVSPQTAHGILRVIAFVLLRIGGQIAGIASRPC